MALERRLNDPALHAAPAAVDQPHFAQALFRCRVDIVRDDVGDVARRERMQIQLALDRNADGAALRHFSGTPR